MPKTISCEKCHTKVELTTEQYGELNRRLQLTFTCPKCHTEQTRKLIPPISAPPRSTVNDEPPPIVAPVPEVKPVVYQAPAAPPPWGSAVQPVLAPQPTAKASAPASEAPPPWGQRNGPPPASAPSKKLGPTRPATPEPDEPDYPDFNAQPKRSFKQKMSDMPPFAQYGLLFGAIVLMAVVVFAIPMGESKPNADKGKAKPDFSAPKEETPKDKDKEPSTPKSEDPKKVEPKPEEPKKTEDPKKEESKKTEPKGEEPKKAEPKGEEPKKVDEPKKDELPPPREVPAKN